MYKSITLFGSALSLAGCSQSAEMHGNASVSNSAAAEPSKPAYCFFKDSETKAWKAKIDKNGDVVVSGKAYREDARYKALLSPAKVSGSVAELSPTITVNDTGYAAPANWWTVSSTIPHSEAVTSVSIKCGDKVVATLAVPRKK